jgi:hypothetical protein
MFVSVTRAKSFLIGSTILLGLSGMAQAQVAADIPASLNGTYELTYAFAASSGSPYANGDKVTFVINGDTDTLCVAGKALTSPFHRTAGASEAIFQDGTTFYAPSATSAGTLNEINVYSPNSDGGSWVGQFQGSLSSSATTCAGGSSSGTLSLDSAATSVLDLAFEVYPNLFGQGSELKEAQGYVYRFFASSGIYVGFKDGRVYVVGGPFGDKILDKGLIATVTTALNTAKTNLSVGGSVDVGGSGAATGDLWDITISGTTTITLPVVGAQTTTISALTLENVTSTNPSSEAEIEKIIEDNFKDYGTIKQLEVVILNNTSSRVTLDLTFVGTVVSSGVSVDTNYNLRYDFVKK